MMTSLGTGSEVLQVGYGYGREVEVGFEQTLERTRSALKEEGFGVLCEIDMQAKLKEKLGVEFRKYVIFGVCNPPIAYQALQAELNLGLLLPCNVVVYENENRSAVVAIDALKLLSIVENPLLREAAAQVNEKLRRAVDRV